MIEYFRHASDETFSRTWPDWKEARRSAIPYGRTWKKYGMHSQGNRHHQTRWSEKPTILIPTILSNIRNLNRVPQHQIQSGAAVAEAAQISCASWRSCPAESERRGANAVCAISSSNPSCVYAPLLRNVLKDSFTKKRSNPFMPYRLIWFSMSSFVAS